MLGQPADEEHRRHVIVTAELVTLGKQVATLKDIVAIVTLRVLFVVVLRLFEYRLVVGIASYVLSPIFITIDDFVDNTHKAINHTL